MPFLTHLDPHHPEAERALEEFSIDRPGSIMLIGRHLSSTQEIRCLIRTISLGGAMLDVNAGVEVPNHFFLEILGIRDEIGCTLIKREGSRCTVGFNMLIDPEFLHHVIKLGFDVQ